jgi:isoquinoline 1-oxidoreductase alpha subunit
MDLLVNGRPRPLPEGTQAEMPLLWVLRDLLHLTGTKYGCGVAACGACTVRLGGEAVRSCVTPLSAVQGRAVETIEGLGGPDAPHALQRAWAEHQVPQCGYCQSGMLMAAAALLAKTPRPSDADIDAAITNLCRCGTYPRVRAAIHSAAATLAPVAPPTRRRA